MRKIEPITFTCAYPLCNKLVTRRKQTNFGSCTSGKRYCSTKCAARDRVVIKGEESPSYKTGEYIYRDIAFKHYGEACTICGYAIKEVLEVHHRDGDRSHNNKENLDVLCPTHHKEFDLGIRTYPGANYPQASN